MRDDNQYGSSQTRSHCNSQLGPDESNSHSRLNNNNQFQPKNNNGNQVENNLNNRFGNNQNGNGGNIANVRKAENLIAVGPGRIGGKIDVKCQD